MADTQILIAGAGPTGLVLALWLRRLGAAVRIIDKAAEPGTTSRAVAVQARTLEYYRQIGLADRLVADGYRFDALNFWIRGKPAAHVPLGEIGKGVSPYSFMLIYPQDQHERLLIERLAALGVKVERPVELVDFAETADGIRARLRRGDGSEETCRAAYLAGCDGAHSKVREKLGTGFPGGTYARLFYVADVEARGPVMNGELNVALDTADFLGIFPLKGAGRARFIGTVRADAAARHEGLTWDDVSGGIIERTKVSVDRVNWFSTYHVHHRVAEHFRRGRAFLLGDAGHIHSPVGGQGMNTGIGDAVNLAWKLAAVVQGRAHAAILDSYEPERIAFARRLVATTDRIFTLVTAEGGLARFLRLQLVPRVVPPLLSTKAMRRFLFRTASQTGINYRESRLSLGRAGGVQGGDRLPWIVLDEPASGYEDNHAPLAALDWQVHVYGEAEPALGDACRKRGLALHVFAWHDAMAEKGLERGAVYLLRPDGYVGLADATARPAMLEAYLDEFGIAASGRRHQP